jgi:hypothetical protein
MMMMMLALGLRQRLRIGSAFAPGVWSEFVRDAAKRLNLPARPRENDSNSLVDMLFEAIH